MTILRHPDRPSDTNSAILADFISGSWQLKPEHRTWLDQHAIRSLTASQPGWVFIRGFSSRAGESNVDQALSNRRAGEAMNYLLANPLTDPRHIIAVDARGEDGSGPDEQDDSARWRAVEVTITPARRPVARQLAVAPKLVERVFERSWLIDPAMSGESDTAEDSEAESDDSGWTIVRRHVVPDMSETTPVLRHTQQAYRVIEIHVTQDTVTDDAATMDRCVVRYVWGVAATNVRLFNRSRSVEILSLTQARSWIENPSQHLF